MTDDIMNLPSQFAELRETQNKILEAQEEMREEQRSLRETQNKILEAQEEMRRDIRALHGMYGRQHNDFSNFRGAYAENAARKNNRMIARRIARARGHRVRLTERISYEELRML